MWLTFGELRYFDLQGKEYHSRSPGRPRWRDPLISYCIKTIIVVVLLLFAPVVGGLFLVSMRMSVYLATQQRVILYDRYLDLLDARIDRNYLEDAMLGTSEAAITYFYEPLPEQLHPALRDNIAAAALGRWSKAIYRTATGFFLAPANAFI